MSVLLRLHPDLLVHIDDGVIHTEAQAQDLVTAAMGTHEPDLDPYYPDRDLAQADHLIRVFGGELVRYTPPPGPPLPAGAIY
jgi:hypothetical protein